MNENPERLMVKCDEHTERPMCILCIHLADEAFPFFIGWHERSEEGTPVAMCNRCKAKEKVDPDDLVEKELVPVCSLCFASIKEREEMKATRGKK